MEKVSFSFMAILIRLSGEGFLWCRWEQDPERLLHIWGIQGKISQCGDQIKQDYYDSVQAGLQGHQAKDMSFVRYDSNDFQWIGFLWSCNQQCGLSLPLSLLISLQQRPKPKIPVVHYKVASAPFIICVKLVSRKRVCVLYVCCFWPPVPQVCNLS